MIINYHAPTPPAELTEDQAEIWDRLFSAVEDDWITPSQLDLVVSLVRHIDAGNRYSSLHDRMMQSIGDMIPDTETVKSIDRLAKCREREVRSATSIMTKLRITNQSIRSSKSPSPTKIANPWDVTSDLIAEDSDNESAEG